MYKIKVVFLGFFLWGCRALPLLLFSNRKDIRLIDVESRKTSSSNILINHLEDAAALDFYYTDGMVFWTDFGLEMIKGMQINDSRTQRDIITTGLLSPDGLACDWLGKKLYWTDSDTNRIEVSNLDGSYRKVLFWKDLDQPRAIALVPMDGLMFWTDWGEMPKIERASMDGENSTRKIIVSKNIFWPNGLTVDYETKRVYWVDAKLKFISGMDFDGKSRKIIADRDLLHPFSLTLYKDRLYWTDWQMKTVMSCNKYDGQHRKNIMGGGFLTPMGIHVYLSERQPQGPTPCDQNNGGCSHLCLMSSYKPYFSCACPTGVNLLDDKTCADGPQEILLLARRTDIRRISLDTPDYTDVVLQLDSIRHAIAVDYDPIEHTIYWTDDEAQFIRRAKLDGTEQEDLVTTEVHHPDGIAVDWIARNLYWTDTGTDRIEVARLNGTSRKILITENLDEPRAIVVDPPEGYMYWTDWGSNPLIERAHLDGTNRISIINSSLGWPNGLSIDYETRKLYWGDAKRDKIEMANLDGSDRRVLVSDQLPHIFGFSLLGDYVYWTDWQRRSIERVHKLTGDGRETIIDQLPDLMGLKAVNVHQAHGTSPCAMNNGNCSHLCLNKPNGKYVCSCPMGLELTSDFVTCIVPEAFLLFSRRADIRRISLESKHDDIIPVSGVAEANALDYDINDNRIYWTDTHYKTINRAFMNGSNIEHLIQFGLEYPEGMAVDWIAHNLYWTDIGSNRIEVARLDGSHRRVLIWQDLEEPHSLTLDPSEGYMYWVNWGSNPRIERSAMDGSYRTTLISKVGRANGLTIDYKERRLYWTDIDAKVIESSNLTGNSRSQVISNLLKPYVLTQYQDYIYWADWATGSIERAAKTNGENQTRIQSQLDYVVDILVYHMSRQSGWNPCAVNNGGCSHLCLALPSQTNQKSYSYSCSCPSHYELSQDNKTCLSPKNFMLFSLKNTIGRMLPGAQNSPDIILPIPQLKSLKALEYDVVDKFIYWIDGRTQVIRRAYDNGTMVSTVIHNPSDIIHPFDMVIEPFSRTLYWSCAQNNVINVTRLNGKAIGIIVNGEDEKPRHLALHHGRGLIFWTNIAHPPRIELASLDGMHKQDIISEGLIQPGALTIDSLRDILFWSDLNTKKIEMMNINTHIRKTLVVGNSLQPTSLATLEEYLYWIDRDQQVIERVDKLTGENQSRMLSRMTHLTDLVAVSLMQDPYNNPCFDNNGGCSHLCIVNEKGEKYCSCPVGLILSSNGKSCINPPSCKADEFRCHAGKLVCIPEYWRCDGYSECDDRSDELNCANCKPYQYRCKNDKCIDHKLLCNGVPNCPDGDDETCCEKDKYYCASLKKCITIPLTCRTAECSESMDEASLRCKQQAVGLITMETAFESKANYTIGIVVAVVVLFIIGLMSYFCKRKSLDVDDNDDVTDINMTTKPLTQHKTQALNLLQPIIVPSHCSANNSSSSMCMGHLSGNGCQHYDRNHVTGASSNSSMGTPYPQETLNPPPSPVTVLSQYTEYCSSHGMPPSMRVYQCIWKKPPPHPTPCSTDVCDDSESYSYDHRYCNGRTESSYDSDPYPPPPTPRSHCFSDDNCGTCPPSPSTTVQSFYNPLPPPPSPGPESDS